MHDALLTVHSLVRWIALVAAVAATLVVARDHGDRQRGGGVWGAVLTGALDLQLLVGIGLLLSLNVFANMAETMRDPVARFFAVEHETLMVLAVVISHVGRVLSRKAASPAAARRTALICFALVLVLLIAGTPWPFRELVGRPWVRL